MCGEVKGIFFDKILSALCFLEVGDDEWGGG